LAASGLMCAGTGSHIVPTVSESPAADLGIAALRQQQARLETLRRWPMRLGPALLVGLTALAAFENRPGPHPGPSGRALVVSAALAVLALAWFGMQATARRSRSGYIAFSGLIIAGSAVLLWAQPTGPGSADVYIGVLLVALLLPVRAAISLSAAAFVVLALVDQLTGSGVSSAAVMVGFSGFFGMMYLADRLIEANGDAELLLTDAAQSRAAQAEAAGLAERQRVAREIHDVLAHSLAGLMLQLEAARMLAAGSTGDARLSEAIERAHHLARSGLEEARRAIDTLRGDELPGPERLPGLAAQFEQDLGVCCVLTVTGSERQLSSQARLAVYRVAQEALTNIAKHACPDGVELCLSYEPGATRLTVEDYTTAPSTRPGPGDSPGYGYGLAGMRERAELLGGSLIARTTASGFKVELEVPE
jgi:signal transduction histidine kinase